MASLEKCNCLLRTLILTTLAITLIKASHPMLYFNADEVPKLRHKAKTTHAKIAKVIEEAGRSLKDDTPLYLPPKSYEKFGSRWNELYGNNLCAFAMYCLLYPDDQEALEIVTLYMDRMTSYDDWYVASSKNVDQVPLAHSLTGYATAFDFLYDKFSATQKERYVEKIRVETERMYKVIEGKKSGWVKQHIHNHAATNLIALLLGALVYEVHFPEPELPWTNTAVDLLGKAMTILSYIVDGSCDEGVAYGSYTSRGITQFVYLAKRHLNIDHTENPWLREHFWFFFATAMPGYQRTVGIGDSNHNWFYGPESQLVFLDSFVMKNGYGNWLADRIRSGKPKNPPLSRSFSQRWSTIHTEFVFYNASIKSTRPVWPNNSSLHIFSDWGVVTYGGGQYLKKGNTFLSFKSSPMHGEAVADIVEHKLLSHFVEGWVNFNPGHEHTDQNSFVFAPNGRYFITEALYAPKHTHLNNVITFAPSPTSKCNNPWEGQIGECSKWLRYKYLPVPRGRIVSVASSNNLVHIAGEAVKSYRDQLGLESVQRSLLLLHSEILLVLDTIFVKRESKIKRASAYFHNILHQFHPYRHAGYQGAQVIYPEGPYAFFWVQPDGKSPFAQLQNQVNDAEYKQRTTNFVNVTFRIQPEHATRIAFLFLGPNVQVQSLTFLKESNDDMAYLKLIINNVEHKISIASTTTSLKRRMKLLGFGGYATVQADDITTFLGKNKNPPTLNRCDVKDDVASFNFVRSLISSHNFSAQMLRPTIDEVQSQTLHSHASVFIIGLFALVVLWFIRRRISRWKYAAALLLTWIVLFWYFVYTDYSEESERFTCSIKNVIETFETNKPPNIFIVSLPGSGADILKMVFDNSTDFIYLSSEDVTIPTTNEDPNRYNPCSWPESDSYAITAGWFNAIATEPLLFLNNLPKTNAQVENSRRNFRLNKHSSRLVVNLLSGFWNAKLPWLQRVVGQDIREIIVVRDPRDWVYSLLRDGLSGKQTSRQSRVKKMLLSNVTCLHPATQPWEYQRPFSSDPVERLAQIWAAGIAHMIRNGRSLQIVRFEDFLSNPFDASTSLMRHLGLNLPVPNLNRVIRSVRSGDYYLDYEGPITLQHMEHWKNKLPKNDVVTIERICGKLMHKLGYL